jgi:hypothetical protein
MNYKLILLVLVSLFIGANLLCGCCRYPVFTYLMGRNGAVGKEGIDNKNVGPPGSSASVKKAADDVAEILKNATPTPALVQANQTPMKEKSGMANLSDGFQDMFKKGMSVISPVNEGLTSIGSDINEVQNGDVAGMWVTKANTYASEFGYGNINNTGSSYSADEPLKNGEMVIFAKNKFKPECCPAPYSSSTGCVCMTPEQINYLNTRGGNRTSDSGV